MNCFRSIRSVLLLAGLMAAMVVRGADVTAAFDEANKLYEQGKFAEAAKAYEQILPKGETSPALLFNVGNAYFKAGERGKAIAAYRRAERLAPRDPDLRANLQFVQDQIQGPTLQPSRIDQWLAKLTLNEWTVLTCAAFWLTLVLLTLMQFRPASRQSLRGLFVVSCAATLALFLATGSVHHATKDEIAIVTNDSAVVRNGPLDESPNAFVVHDGGELNVLDSKDDWLKVGIGNRVGWLKRDQAIVQPGS